MEERYIWMRLGITIRGSEEEMESLFNEDKKSYETLSKILQERRFEINGDSYIPETKVEEYNKEYNTQHEVGDYGFNL
jgi:DNA replication protein DnaC